MRRRSLNSRTTPKTRAPAHGRREAHVPIPDPTAKEGDTHTYRLAFSQWECSACGATFSAMEGCQACGATPPQPDSNVDERRALVEELRARGLPAPDTRSLDLDEAWAEISVWIARLYDGLGGVGEHGREAVRPLATVLDDLAVMGERARVTPRLRPFMRVWQVIDVILERFADLAAANLDVLTAPSPDEARIAEERAQAVLDQAADEAAEAARLAAELGTPTTGGFFDASADRAAAVFGAEGASNLMEFDSRGAALYEQITAGARYEPGLGLSLVLVDHLASDFLDAERFHADVRLGYGVLARYAATLSKLTTDQEWIASLRRAKRELLAALVDLYDGTSGSIQSDFFGIRAMLRLGQNLTEGVAPHYLATLLALRGRVDWRRAIRYDPAQLIRQAEQAGFASLVTGLDIAVRDADAHRDYDMGTGRVRLGSGRGGREVSHGELVDTVLCGLETSLLLDTALTCALAANGYPVDTVDSTSDLIAPIDRVKMLMGAAGLSQVAVALEGRALKITGLFLGPEWSSLPVAAGIEGLAPNEFDGVTFVVRGSDGTSRRDAGPLGPMQRFRDAQGFDRETWTVEAMARWRIGNRRLMPRMTVRCWASRRIRQLIQEDLMMVPTAIESMGGLAERLGDTALASTLEAMKRLTEARIRGVPPPQSDRWAAGRIARWVNDCGSGQEEPVPA